MQEAIDSDYLPLSKLGELVRRSTGSAVYVLWGIMCAQTTRERNGEPTSHITDDDQVNIWRREGEASHSAFRLRLGRMGDCQKEPNVLFVNLDNNNKYLSFTSLVGVCFDFSLCYRLIEDSRPFYLR